jgi:hypothetical protein
MDPTTLKGLTNLEILLIMAVMTLGGAVIVLFKAVLNANTREVDAYKSCAPLMQKLSELCEKLIRLGGEK